MADVVVVIANAIVEIGFVVGMRCEIVQGTREYASVAAVAVFGRTAHGREGGVDRRYGSRGVVRIGRGRCRSVRPRTIVVRIGRGRCRRSVRSRSGIVVRGSLGEVFRWFLFLWFLFLDLFRYLWNHLGCFWMFVFCWFASDDFLLLLFFQ